MTIADIEKEEKAFEEARKRAREEYERINSPVENVLLFDGIADTSFFEIVDERHWYTHGYFKKKGILTAFCLEYHVPIPEQLVKPHESGNVKTYLDDVLRIYVENGKLTGYNPRRGVRMPRGVFGVVDTLIDLVRCEYAINKEENSPEPAETEPAETEPAENPVVESAESADSDSTANNIENHADSADNAGTKDEPAEQAEHAESQAESRTESDAENQADSKDNGHTDDESTVNHDSKPLTMTKEKAMKKIEKLLALSENNPSEEQAKQALLKARELMAKYGLFSVGADSSEKLEIEQILIADVKHSIFNDMLLSKIASAFFCLGYKIGKKNGYQIEGEKGTIMIAARLFYNCVTVMHNGAKAACKDAGYKQNQEGAAAIRNSYMLGFIEGLENAIETQNEALVIDNDELRQELEKRARRLKPGRKTRIRTAGNDDYGARDKGRAEGAKIGRTAREQAKPERKSICA